ncbi:MAG: oligosaccharide flippase family protein [Lachnospiraceae bacterium]|nr:oligosaccharide flippase family protein [Lachnospiraceae bacterium]
MKVIRNKLVLLKLNYSQMPKEVKASAWYLACNLVQNAVSFVTIPIYVKSLTAAEYGKYSVFLSWKDILLIFATLNLYYGFYTKAMVDHPDKKDLYTSCMQGLSTIVTLVCIGGYFLFKNLADKILKLDSKTICLLFAYFLFFPAFSFWQARQKVEYRYKAFFLISTIVNLIYPVISIILLQYTPLRERAVIWGYLGTHIIVGMFFYFYQMIKGRSFFHINYWRYALQFNLPLVPHYLSVIVLGQVDRIMIQRYCGDAKAGIYSLAYQIAGIINIFIMAINASLVPWIYTKLKEKKYSEIAGYTQKFCMLVGGVALPAILISPELILIIGNVEYLEAIWIIPSVTLGTYFVFCYGLFSAVEFYFGYTKFVSIASIAGAILNVVLNGLLIPFLGYIMAGYTTLLCYLFFAIVHYLFMKQICRKEHILCELYNIRFMGIFSILICVLAFGEMLLYEWTYLRYIFITFCCFIVWKKRHKLIGLVMSEKENN